MGTLSTDTPVRMTMLIQDVFVLHCIFSPLLVRSAAPAKAHPWSPTKQNLLSAPSVASRPICVTATMAMNSTSTATSLIAPICARSASPDAPVRWATREIQCRTKDEIPIFVMTYFRISFIRAKNKWGNEASCYYPNPIMHLLKYDTRVLVYNVVRLQMLYIAPSFLV